MSRRWLRCVIAALSVMLGTSGCERIESAHTQGGYPETMLALQNHIRAHGYTVLRVQRVDVGMKRAGYEIEEYRVVFFAKPDEVNRVLKAYPELVPFLPLSITIYRDDEQTKLAGMPFALPKSQASTEELRDMVAQWERDTAAIIQGAVSAIE